MLWLCLVVSGTSSYYTSTHIIRPSHFTKNVSLPTTRSSSHATFWLRHRYGPKRTKLCWVLFLSTDVHRRFQYIIHENLYMKFPHSSQAKNKLSFHKCIQFRHMVCKFWCRKFCVSWVCIVGKWPFLWTKQWLLLQPDVQKGCKILKTSCLEIQTDFTSSCQNFRPSCQVQCGKRRILKYLSHLIPSL